MTWNEPIRGSVYIIRSNGLYKIGRAKNVRERLKAYTTQNPFGISVLFQQIVNDYVKVEEEMLARFPNKRVRGEWFDLTEREVQQIIGIARKNV